MRHIAFGALIPLLLSATMVFAQSQPRLIEPAHFGTVRDVLGASRLVALPQAKCAADMSMDNSKICWQTTVTYMKAHSLTSATVVGLEFMPVSGQALSWSDIKLFKVTLDGQRPSYAPIVLPTSEVKVPRYCFAINGEKVHYIYQTRAKIDMVQEHQIVVCDGGPPTPNGPYSPEGPSIPAVAPEINSAPSITEPTFRATGEVIAEGSLRYLAYPDPNCDKANLVRETLCAAYPIAQLTASADKEADLIGAKRPVAEGDRLYEDEVDQLVLKKKSKGFKADKRWFAKSFYSDEAGCRAIEGVHYRVKSDGKALWVAEQALNRCGAPDAPVPAEIYESYGRDLFILYCDDDRRHRFERHKDNDGGYGACFSQARDYLQRNHHTSARFVVLNDRARVDDRLFDGGYIAYDVADVSLDREGRLEVNRLDNYGPIDVAMSRCAPLNDGKPESRGFIIVRSMGIQWARPYRYMSCPIW